MVKFRFEAMKTELFLHQFDTCQRLISYASLCGATINLETAHRAWLEHSDDYDAGWLVPDSASGNEEIRRALNKYFYRRKLKPLMPEK